MKVSFGQNRRHSQISREYTNLPLLGGWKRRPPENPLLSVHLYHSYTYRVTKLQTDVMIWILKENSGRHSSLILYRHLKDVTAYFNTDLFYSLLSRELFIPTHHYRTWLANLESQFTKYKELIFEEASQYCQFLQSRTQKGTGFPEALVVLVI